MDNSLTVSGDVNPICASVIGASFDASVIKSLAGVDQELVDGVYRYKLVKSTLKEYCRVCCCYIRSEGHEFRCAPKAPRVPKVWDDTRSLAWLGDSVQRVDMQIAARIFSLTGPRLEAFMLDRVTNSAMAAYMRRLGHVGSEVKLGTLFESQYRDRFRVEYLRDMFTVEVVCDILSSWTPPDLRIMVVDFSVVHGA